MGNLDDVKTKIIELSHNELETHAVDVFRESQKQLLHIFSNIYFIDGAGATTRVKCIPGKMERAIAKQFKDNALVLPLISINEEEVDTNFDRGRYSGVLVSSKSWNRITHRAERILSLPPRPVTLKFSINIWAEYKRDLDSIRATIINKFNPDLEISTYFNNITKSFVESESDTSTWDVDDGEDRILRKSIRIKLETWIESPKFLYTQNATIERINTDVGLMQTNINVSSINNSAITIRNS